MTRLLLLATISSLLASAEAITSQRSGEWTSPGTWTGGVVPGDGDTVTIGNRHVVTIAAGVKVEVGTSPADDRGTPALACASNTGTGVLEVRGTFVFRGPVRQCASEWKLGAGATVSHDSSKAPGASYTWRIGMVPDQRESKLVMAGTEGMPVTLNILPGSGRAGGFIGATETTRSSGQIRASFLRATGWGTSSGYFIRSSLDGLGDTFSCDNCRIEDCGRISVYVLSPTAVWTVRNTVITRPVPSANGRYIELAAAYIAGPPTTGQRAIENSYIEGRIWLVTNPGLVNPGVRFRNVVLVSTTAQANFEPGNTPAIAEGDWSDVLICNRVAANTSPVFPPYGTLRRTYILRTGYPTGPSANPHFALFGPGDVTIDGWIFEGSTDAAANGDLLQFNGRRSSGPPQQVRVINSLVVPTPGGQSPGIFTNPNGSAACNGTTVLCPELSVERNTWPGWVPAQPRGQYGMGGETMAGWPGIYQRGRDNIVWRRDPGPGVIAQWQAGVATASGIFRNFDYNVSWNLAGSPYAGRESGAYDPAPGPHDLNADPDFVEIRHFLDFGRRLKPSLTTWADVLAEFARMEDKRFNVPDLIDWVRAGYRPRNPALWKAGHDGKHAGAVPPTTTFGSASVIF